jgi:hypothetical protein
MKKILLLILTIFLTVFIAGCAKQSGDGLTFKDPVPSGNSGNISGLVFSVLPAKFKPERNQIYYYRDIKVTATNVSTGATHNTSTRNDGVYLFSSIPNGRYNLSATLTLEGVTYKGTLNNIEVRGGITTYMANFIVFDTTKSVTYSGTVKDKNGNPIRGATVNIELSLPKYGGVSDDPAYQTDYYQLGIVGYDERYFDSIIMHTLTDASGRYSFIVPKDDGNTSYFLAARYDNSMVYDKHYPTETVNDFILTTYDILDMPTQEIGFACAYTLKADENLSRSMGGSTTSYTKTSDLLNVWARANKIPSNKLSIVNKVRTNSQKYTLDTVKSQAVSQSKSRSIIDDRGYLVEVDVMWDWAVDNGSFVNVYGYNIYRSSERNGTYYKIAAIQDLFQMIFYDVDPTLEVNKTVYYTVTAYGAFGKESVNSIIQPATAFEPLNISINDTITNESQRLSWNHIDGANSYTVLIYKGENMPLLNIEYVKAVIVGRGTSNVAVVGEDSVGGNLANGTYWVSVIASDVAYNAAVLPGSLSYSGFKKITINM